LEKICFWAIIEGLFAGYAFCGFGFWGKKIACRKMVNSDTQTEKVAQNHYFAIQTAKFSC
jgi:hypothetical protein